MDDFRRSQEDPLHDDAAGKTAADRHVHRANGDPQEGTVPFPTDPSSRRRPSRASSRQSSVSQQGDIDNEHLSGDAVRQSLRKGFQPKRSMTLPDERLMFPDVAMPTSDVAGLGIGFRPQSMRIIKGSPKISESSASSDDEASVPRPQPALGSGLSFRQKRALSSASPGPSKYPGMLLIPDPGVSPKTSPRRRMTSGNSSPDLNHLGNISPGQRSSSPGRMSGPSSLRSPPVASTSRLQAVVDHSIRAGRNRRLSQSAMSVSSADTRLVRRRRTSPGIPTTPVDGGQHTVVASPVSSTFEPGGSGTTTPTSIHPASGLKRNSSLTRGLPLERFDTPSQNGRDSLSSARGANDDESMNEERADVADTINRKRKQSVDPNHAPRRRLTSAEGVENAPGMVELRSGKTENASMNGKGKHRTPLVEMGFEASLGGTGMEEGRPSSSAGKPM